MGSCTSKSEKKMKGDDAWAERDFDYDYSENEKTRTLSSSKGDLTRRSSRLRDLQDKFYVIGDSIGAQSKLGSHVELEPNSSTDRKGAAMKFEENSQASITLESLDEVIKKPAKQSHRSSRSSRREELAAHSRDTSSFSGSDSARYYDAKASFV